MSAEEQLWRATDGERWFIIPEADVLAPGPLVIRALAGAEAAVDPERIRRYEVSEEEARTWAQEELGYALDELRRRIDVKLYAGRRVLDRARHTPVRDETSVTPDAVPALFALLKSLPGAIAQSLSGDPARVRDAGGSMVDLQQRLKAAGIDLESRLAAFPERLAGLRDDFARQRRDGRSDGPLGDP